MPKRQRTGPRRSRRRNAGRRATTIVPFHVINATTLAGSIFQQPVAPVAALSARLSTIADTFDEYRFVSLRYRIRSDTTTSTAQAGMAFYPGVVSSQPNNFAALGENPTISLRSLNDDVVPRWVTVPRAVLAGEQPWYKSQKATITADDSIPGVLQFVGTTTDVIQWEADGVCEFRGESDVSNTPLPRLLAIGEQVEKLLPAARERDIEQRRVARDKLLAILSYVETEEVSVVGPAQWSAPSKQITIKTGQMPLPGKK